VDLELRNVCDRLKEKGLKFIFSDAAKEFLIESGYDEKYGARPLRRAVEKHLEDSLAEALLAGTIKPGKSIHVDLNENGKALIFAQKHVVSTKT
ncbi:MAG: ATP-dependent Clp protease ATP-binding subunit ClpC, partial [Saprospiraceae bacterium]|nr:ATP-dependent Clp protease ATP-binding subunit ClpC [Saprospiraceae bacterium]